MPVISSTVRPVMRLDHLRVRFINPATLDQFLEPANGLIHIGKFLLELDRPNFRLDLAKMRNLSNIGDAAYRHMGVTEAGFYSSSAEQWVTNAMALMAQPELEPHDGIGDLLTLEEFLGDARAGFFTDYDGMGSWATAEGQFGFTFNPSQVASGEDWPPLWATHVMWYNR